MILFTVLGLDEYITGRFSKTISHEIQKIIKNDKEEVFFLAPHSYLFYEGVEQTSWHCLTIISLSSAYKKYESQIAEYFLEATVDYVMNMQIRFEYDDSKHYVRNNNEFPRFIEEDNIMHDEDEEDDYDDADLDENTIFFGNAFEGYDFEEGHRTKKAEPEYCEGDECENCDCDENDEDCDCHNHHH